MAVVSAVFPDALDDEVVEGFLKGLSDVDVALLLGRRLGLDEESLPLVFRDAVDQLRSLGVLERALAEPLAYSQGAFPLVTLRQEAFDALSDRYYSLSPRVIRAVLGKILSSRVRAGLDAAVDSSSAALASPNALRLREALRNFDCLRRVYDAVEAAAASLLLSQAAASSSSAAAATKSVAGDWSRLHVFGFLRSQFRLNANTAWTYCCVLWLLKNRFNIASDTTAAVTTTTSNNSNRSAAGIASKSGKGATSTSVTTVSRWHARATGEAFLNMASAALCCWTRGVGIDALPSDLHWPSAVGGGDWSYLRFDRKNWLRPFASVVVAAAAPAPAPVSTSGSQPSPPADANESAVSTLLPPSNASDAISELSVARRHSAAKNLLLQRNGSEGSLVIPLASSSSAASPGQQQEDGAISGIATPVDSASGGAVASSDALSAPAVVVAGSSFSAGDRSMDGGGGGGGSVSGGLSSAEGDDEIGRSLSVSSAPAATSLRLVLRRGDGEGEDASDRHYYHRHHSRHAQHYHSAREQAAATAAATITAREKRSAAIVASGGLSLDPALLDGLSECFSSSSNPSSQSWRVLRKIIDGGGSQQQQQLLVSAVVTSLSASLKRGEVPVFVLGPAWADEGEGEGGGGGGGDAAVVKAMEELREGEASLLAKLQEERGADRLCATFRCLRDVALSFSSPVEFRDLFNRLHSGVVVTLRDELGIKDKKQASLVLSALAKAGVGALLSVPSSAATTGVDEAAATAAATAATTEAMLPQEVTSVSGSPATAAAAATTGLSSSSSAAAASAWMRFLTVVEVCVCSLYPY